MSEGKLEPSWWGVVKTLASFVVSGHSEEELSGVEVKTKLLDSGYGEDEISQAYLWLDKVNLSGCLSESLSMLHPHGEGFRVENPIETIFLPEKLRQIIQVLRLRGLLSDDLLEKLLEGIRTLDTREWDDTDIKEFVLELLLVVMPNHSREQYLRILEGKEAAHLYH